MKKSQSKLQVIINYYKESEPTLLYLAGEEEGTKDEVFVLGDGNVIWLSDVEGPEVPMLSVEKLAQDHPDLIFELFSADEEEKLDAKKLYVLEDKLRKALKATSLSEEEVRDVKIAFMDAKEAVLG